ncbi:MAG TPA: trypsin-like peptidase domain-containing protein [Bacteroidales bacterium]|jgi:Do/DeqQ family serine protease|nr:trypsin-like peptidase domain-containing protein [Bacteroidales bacterium]HKM13155.1 trypsin-like peptidase domain-containing protein [Bacteroidales bacterium]HPB89526.1 trypsin-like peptidase domain-containing protein [Bacteroidales bacterium]HPY21294.1 trypsin-like peptidase domain-containing protein [Bacteroidales bacterium]HQA92683.1 trypsin-like peptidase domain-containing protein [Bacteroidales bacterium]
MKRNTLFLLITLLLSLTISWLVADKVVDTKLAAATAEADGGRSSAIARAHGVTNRTVIRTDMGDFSDAAETAVHTVVYVKVVKRAAKMPSSIMDLIFGFATPKDQVGMGSGVIIREDGYIVTNNHVIDGADQIEVTLENNESYPAKLVGTDPATDIALLKIDEDSLPAIALGDSDNLRLGEWVLAIGSPYDLRSTITAGIVSAKGRSLPNYDGQYRVESFIQTDAAVNPGNSGGALINTLGELVGINTSIISLTGSYAGYSFAVPVNIVRKITEDFIRYGEVRRALLGISITDITDSMARQFNLESMDGVYVAEVQPNSAAEKGGIKVGDIITEINLNRVRNGAAVQEQMNRLRPGEQAVITVKRGGKQIELIVSL